MPNTKIFKILLCDVCFLPIGILENIKHLVSFRENRNIKREKIGRREKQ